MHVLRLRTWLLFCCPVFLMSFFSQTVEAKTLCVAQGGSHSCYTKIQSAVNAASDYDVIKVAPGVYKEDVVIGKPLSLIGAGKDGSVIDAAGLPNGVLIDGHSHAGLHDVTIAAFTVKNALYEGILIVSASDVTIRDNRIVDNDQIPHTFGQGTACKGQPSYETDESGDCGGGLHLIGTSNSIISGNYIAKNADGILLSDETAETRGNLITHNVVIDNPEECGIVLASHNPEGSTPPHFARHYGVDNNTVSENVANRNGVKVGGAGFGLFSDGAGPGRVSGNVAIGNKLIGNGIAGVALHTHVGPAFGAPADDMDGNMIIGNFIAQNGPDEADTATPGPTGININSGGGGSPVRGTIISRNVIRDEEVDVAVNTPAEVDIHVNDLLGGDTGVANVCSFDHASCKGTAIDAIQNFWGCPTGPGTDGCSSTSGSGIRFEPPLREAASNDTDDEE